MCDEREQLIEYVYGEAAAGQRARIDAHLSECPECRAEVAALKGVRADLLAWEIPTPEPIWRPMPRVAPKPIWRQVPAWALAAAASAVFATGMAGGVATRVFFMEPAPAVVATTAPAVPVPAVGVSESDLAAMEARIAARVRAEMDNQIRTAVRASTSVSPRSSVDALAQQVSALERWQYEQVVLNDQFDRTLKRLSTRTSTLDARLSTDSDMRMIVPVNFGGVR